MHQQQRSNMKKKKSLFQKLSFMSSIISFMSAIACIVGAYIIIQSQGINDPVGVAFLAATFFFISVGAVLLFIANANIPSFDMQIEPSNKS